jgi:hypothetical protein
VKVAIALLLLSTLSLSTDDLTEEAERLLGAELFADAVELLAPEVKDEPEDPELRELYSQALAGVGRLDEAAHQLQTAIDLLVADGDASAERSMRRRMARIDPEANAVRSFWNKTTDLMGESARNLMEEEQIERAAIYLEGLIPFVGPKEREELQALLEIAKDRQEELDLGRAEQRNRVRTIESKHYKISAALEKETVDLVADTMDRLFDFYVDIYFDGDVALVAELIPEKATLYIHGTKSDMFSDYPGGAENAPAGLGGWWQPGQNVVHAYDTSTTNGTREELLGTLFHEASHQFMTALCNQGGGWAPAWLNEGTSSFFEGATILVSGEVLWPDAAVMRLRTLSHFLSRGGGPGVEKVLEYAAPGSYPGEYYCYGWGLMYFMQEYEDPKTLEKVYRPLYAEYRKQITTAKKRRPPLPLFKEIFLGSNSPLGHETLEEFSEDWRDWILKSVRPLSLGNARRAARIKRAERYLAAVERWGDSKPAESERRLEQALNDFEYIITKLDDEELPDVDLLLAQKKILERLKRPKTESVIIERILDAVDRDLHELSKSEYKDLEERLGRLDRKNSVLRLARSRARLQAGRSTTILDRYEELDPPFLLRAAAFATQVATALADPKIEARAKDLRARCAEAGLLAGAGRKLFAKKTSDWSSLFPPANEALFRQSKTEILVESKGGAPAGRVCTTVEVTGEYEIRGTLKRAGIEFGTIHGIVYSGNETDGWMIIGIDYEGALVLRLATKEGSRVTFKNWDNEITEEPDPPIAEDEDPTLTIRVLPEGTLFVTIGEREAIEIELPVEMPKKSYVGVFVKGGEATFSGVTIEDFL